MARYNGRLHCIVGVLPTCYKRKAATYFYPPGGTGPACLELQQTTLFAGTPVFALMHVSELYLTLRFAMAPTVCYTVC